MRVSVTAFSAKFDVLSLSSTMALAKNKIYGGDSTVMLRLIEKDSVALSVWSPPYFVGKEYERHLTYEKWLQLLEEVIRCHFAILQPGGFMAINIADILCFPDENLPRFQAENLRRRRSDITREMVLEAKAKFPNFKRDQLAKHLGCSEQTIDRRLNGNNIRGGKYATQTRVHLVGNLLEEFAYTSGLFLYDRRVWVKDAAWENSRWTSLSYRAVDEFEYIYIFWKPGATVVDKGRLSTQEWTAWGSRAVWNFPSVRANNDHEAKFPLELPRRLIQLLSAPDDLILDPFMGSGTTAVAAIEQDRDYLGFDLHLPYVEMANAACETAKAKRAFLRGQNAKASESPIANAQLTLLSSG